MANNRQNWIAERLRQQQANNELQLGTIRAARRFDINNYERVINDVTGRLTSQQSQRLAVAKKLGADTRGLIVGGQRDDKRPPGQVPGSPPPSPKRPPGVQVPGILPPGVRPPPKQPGGR